MVSEMFEEFRLIQGFEDYQISNMGRVYSLKTKRILRPQSNGLGYFIVRLSKDGKQSNYKIHRFVAQEFIENLSNGLKLVCNTKEGGM